ncbi:MAG: uncharacterized protein KVP18_000348 [Porospora cf. gigantea A]|uniref:uncharacterized protein n=1 Tax=Porospora cf. gigantea A TaxID=2853593 RepID=UPI00355A1542|nr:MAG: hypothetical protein KVP18_000348 [Porospora cf. gigantea A]
MTYAEVPVDPVVAVVSDAVDTDVDAVDADVDAVDADVDAVDADVDAVDADVGDGVVVSGGMHPYALIRHSPMS